VEYAQACILLDKIRINTTLAKTKKKRNRKTLQKNSVFRILKRRQNIIAKIVRIIYVRNASLEIIKGIELQIKFKKRL
jgi:hypothetical protein